MKKSRIYKLVIMHAFLISISVFLFINCKTINNDPYWKTIIMGKTKMEILMKDSVAIQNNYYVNGQLDSFSLFNPYDVNRDLFPSAFGGKTTFSGIKKVLSYYADRTLFTKDSFHIFIWKPVERGYLYHYEMYRNNRIIWDRKCENEPIIEFVYN